MTKAMVVWRSKLAQPKYNGPLILILAVGLTNLLPGAIGVALYLVSYMLWLCLSPVWLSRVLTGRLKPSDFHWPAEVVWWRTFNRWILRVPRLRLGLLGAFIAGIMWLGLAWQGYVWAGWESLRLIVSCSALTYCIWVVVALRQDKE